MPSNSSESAFSSFVTMINGSDMVLNYFAFAVWQKHVVIVQINISINCIALCKQF